MAIDTKAKRMSMLSAALPAAWIHHFEVDGAVDADDRAQLLHRYGGIAFSAPAATIVGASVAAAAVYHPGSQKAMVFHPGAKAAEVYHPGAKTGMTQNG